MTERRRHPPRTHDMLLYLQANLDSGTGSADSDLHRTMQTRHTIREALTEDVGVGLGWQIPVHDGREIVTHDGGSGGYSSRMAFDREHGIGFVLLANTGQFEGHQFGLDFLRFGPVLDLPEVLVAGETLDRHVGEYEMAPGTSMFVRREAEQTLELDVFARDGQLMAQAAGQGAGRLRHQGDHTFIPDFDARLVFIVEDGRAVSVTLHQRGQTAVGRRQPDPR